MPSLTEETKREQAVALIRKIYGNQPELKLAIGTDPKYNSIVAIGSWDKDQNRYVSVIAYAITGTWVHMPYEILVNGELLKNNWEPVWPCAEPIGIGCQECGTTNHTMRLHMEAQQDPTFFCCETVIEEVVNA